MNWLGKVIGGSFGFLVGGPFGAVMGAALGHQFDREAAERSPFRVEVDSADQYRVQTAFFTAVFSVMGHIAKSDGRVNEAEIKLAQDLMGRLQLNGEMRRSAMSLFSEGKRPDFPLDAVLEQFRSECRNRYSLIRAFVEFQLELALADGSLHQSEERKLLRICERLHFSRFEFHALKTALEAQIRFAGGWRQQETAGSRREPTLEEAYAALGVDGSASDDEVRRAYRRLLSRHHPDKLVAEPMPEEKVRFANERTHEIRQAWDTIRKARKI